jgi:ankyrin repeat protein
MEDVQRMQESGLGMAARDDSGCTALHCAAASGRPDMVSFMLDLHAVEVGLM